MKTLQELYTEVMASDEMKKEFIEAFKQKEATEAALKKYSCDASFEEFQAFMKEKQEDDEIVNEEDVKAIAGGTSKYEALVTRYEGEKNKAKKDKALEKIEIEINKYFPNEIV